MNETHNLIKKAEEKIMPQLKAIDELSLFNSNRVWEAFHLHQISDSHFHSTSGYGYNDFGRDTIEKVFATILDAEDSLVRSQFISGTHALTVALFAFLRPGDTLLSITGKPYDTLEEVIGIRENPSSLKSFGIHYEQIDLTGNDFDYEKIKKRIQASPIKVIEIQRSKGYSTRQSILIEQIKKVVEEIRSIDSNVIIMVDNCYCEFVSKEEPLTYGVDIIVGSLIKNLGGGIAPNGGYIAGRKDLVALAGERLTVPGEGKEVGPSLGVNQAILQGLFFAPNAVASSLKTATLASQVLLDLGYPVEPLPDQKRADIVQTITFQNPHSLIQFCQGIQKGSLIDSFVIPEPWEMPGYTDPIIMASGSFTQGSSIELSCDGPIRPPYVAYLQGGLTYEYGKIGLSHAIEKLKETHNS